MGLSNTLDIRATAGIREAAKLRVAVISDALPERNGVGTYYHDLVEHLRDYIEHAELICPDCDGGPRKTWLSFPLPGDRTQNVTIPPMLQIQKRIRQIAPHAVIVPTPGPYGLLGVCLAKRQGAGLLVGFHTNYEKLTDLYWNPFLGEVSRALLRAFNRFFFRFSTLVLANSEEMVVAAHNMGAKKVRLMGTPIARQFLQRPVTPLSDKISSILYAGRLATEKNVHSVIAAAQDLPNIQYFIAGDGPLHDLIVARSSELSNLTYLGWLPRSNMPETLDNVDMLLLPSQVESFGTTALEGMARNRIVLASEDCGIFDWPSLNRNIFRISKTESVTDAIRRITQLDHQRWKEKAEGACKAARRFNDRTIDNWIKVLITNGAA